MELLSKEIRKNGFIYRFLKRGGRALIYEQYDPELDEVIAWEVFKLKVDKPKVVFGIQLNEREIFPGNEDFGKWAWAYCDLDRALSRFMALENEDESE